MADVQLPIRSEGGLRPSLLVSWFREGGEPEDLTNATLTGVIRSMETGIVRAIAGVLTVTDGANGVFRWDFHADDVVAGDYEVFINAAFLSNPTPARSFSAFLSVKPFPTVTP